MWKTFPAEPVDIDLEIKKGRMVNLKRDLEKQIFQLRMKHNAMLKSEYEEKMKKLQDKWQEVENASVDDVPDKDEIEQMVGLVSKKMKVQTMHEMIKEKTKEDYAKEEQESKKFIQKMRHHKAERQAF